MQKWRETDEVGAREHASSTDGDDGNAELDEQLAASLIDVFWAELRARLDPGELTHLESIRTPPVLERVLWDGRDALRLTFFGGESLSAWDGSSNDAREVVRDFAESAAGSVSGDHWIQGDGWRAAATTEGPPTP